MRKITITFAVVAALTAIGGCDADPTTEDPPEVVNATETEQPDAAAETEEPEPDEAAKTEEPEPDEAEPGTRDNPLDLGTAVTLDGYEVAVTEIVLNADEIMADPDLFNEPAEGQYVLVTLAGTFVGGDDTPEGNPGFDLSAVIVGSDAAQYRDSDSFATPPDALFNSPTLEAGGEFTGNVVLDVPVDALNGALLFVEPLIAFDNDQRAFWALPETG